MLSILQESISNEILLNVVFVHVCSRKSYIGILAVLDQGSMTTLFDASLFKSLEIGREKISYAITTVNQISEQCNGQRLSY